LGAAVQESLRCDGCVAVVDRTDRFVTLKVTPSASSAARSAEDYGEGEARFAVFLVLAVHVLGGLRQCQDGRVEIDAVPGRDLVAGDRDGGPGLDGPGRAPL